MAVKTNGRRDILGTLSNPENKITLSGIKSFAPGPAPHLDLPIEASRRGFGPIIPITESTQKAACGFAQPTATYRPVPGAGMELGYIFV